MLATSLQARVGLLELLRPFTPPPARGQPNAALKTQVRHRGIWLQPSTPPAARNRPCAQSLAAPPVKTGR